MTIDKQTDALIFDMDGTLWDAVDTYATIWNMAFAEIGSTTRISRSELLAYMGTPIDKILAHFVPEPYTQAFIEAINRLEVSELPRLGGTLYPGVTEGITTLAQHYKLFILSNCDERELPIFIRYAGLTSCITDVLSYGDTRLQKAENMQLLSQRYNLRHPVYVGDTDGDSRESRRAAIPFVWVSYGFGKTNDYDLQFDSFEALTRHFISLKTNNTL